MTTRNTATALATWIVMLGGVDAVASATESKYEVRVTGARVNVRAQPTTSSEVLFQVTRGDMLHLVATADSWYLVKAPDGKQGYIFKTLVEIIELAPVVTVDRPTRGEARVTTAVPVRTHPVAAPDAEVDAVAEAQAKSWADKKRRSALYKLVGGSAGVVSGFVVMGSSKPAGIGLVGAGGYFLWDGYTDRQEAGRRLRWTLLFQMNRDVKGVAYHMSW